MSAKQETRRIPQRYAARTDVGCVRGHNEDSFVTSSPLFVVADGMGGHEAGEVASEIAIETMLAHIPKQGTMEELAEAVKAANLAVMQGAADGTGKPGMGTTMTAATIVDDELIIAQVGDSRAYLLHEGDLQRVTRDHSLVAGLIEQGRLTEEAARYHPQRSVITRALGSDPHMEPDLYTLQVQPGDRLLLCSDGLCGMIEDSAIEATMRRLGDPQACCDALVEEALAAGGLDNVTVIVVDPFGDSSTKGSEHGKPGHRLKRFRGPIIWILAFILVIGAAAGGFYAYARSSYYLIAENGFVAIYQGIPGEVLGVHASWLYRTTNVATSQLAPTTALRLQSGIAVDSEAAAEQLVASYEQTATSTQSTPTTSPSASTSTQTTTTTGSE